MAADTTKVQSVNTASTNIPTNSYVELFSSTPIACSKLGISNNTSSTIVVAVGASGSEVEVCAITKNTFTVLALQSIIAKGSRISLRAVDAAASSGYVAVSTLI